MERESRIYVAGHQGMVGSAILRCLETAGFEDISTRARGELDLADPRAVEEFFASERPEYVFLAASKVGSVPTSTYPATVLRENLAVELNVIEAAYRYGVKRLLFLGGSCIYPRSAPQPVKEEYLLAGKLEPDSEAYAIARIAGIKLCQAYNRQYGTNFISAVSAHLYGSGEGFDPESSYLLPALIREFHGAKEGRREHMMIWGTGSSRREFLHVDDLADACVYLMDNYSGEEIVNVGSGKDVSIEELAQMIGEVVGYEGDIVFDASKPDAIPSTLLDVSRLNSMGWRARIPLREGIERTYEWFLDQENRNESAPSLR